jgi:hypothetical protein
LKAVLFLAAIGAAPLASAQTVDAIARWMLQRPFPKQVE